MYFRRQGLGRDKVEIRKDIGEVELSSGRSSNISFDESRTESSFSPATSTPVASDRRQKIAQFLKDEREKKMTPRVSLEAQQLKCVKEDLEWKRK